MIVGEFVEECSMRGAAVHQAFAGVAYQRAVPVQADLLRQEAALLGEPDDFDDAVEL
jgi:hypothetical protein